MSRKDPDFLVNEADVYEITYSVPEGVVWQMVATGVAAEIVRIAYTQWVYLRGDFPDAKVAIEGRSWHWTHEEFLKTLELENLPVDPRPNMISADDLKRWWMDQASMEVDKLMGKAIEYGGRGAAIDLIDIGQALAQVSGRTLSVEEQIEWGIFFYIEGKFARWKAAMMEGRRVSDDTLHDVSVYCRMAQRNRAVGGWPYKAEER